MKLSKYAPILLFVSTGLLVACGGSSGTDEEEVHNGEAGPRGPAGPTGPKGDDGAKGATGATGVTGKAGATGAKGSQGDKGDQGDKGATGPAGSDGDGGGPAGAQGAAGAVGAQGPIGPVGATGALGATGATGTIGATGAMGATGTTGATGATGSVANSFLSVSIIGGEEPVPPNAPVEFNTINENVNFTPSAPSSTFAPALAGDYEFDIVLDLSNGGVEGVPVGNSFDVEGVGNESVITCAVLAAAPAVSECSASFVTHLGAGQFFSLVNLSPLTVFIGANPPPPGLTPDWGMMTIRQLD